MEEDLRLSKSLQQLELEGPKRRTKTLHNTNPFRRRSKSLSSISTCECKIDHSTVKKTISFKRNGKKVLRSPVLKIVKFKNSHRKAKVTNNNNDKLFGQCAKHSEKDFKSLLNAYKGLSLDGFKAECFRKVRPIESGDTASAVARPPDLSNPAASCSSQARLNANPPCDVTIDELASYFETSVHIPKKMSSMAEMMYI